MSLLAQTPFYELALEVYLLLSDHQKNRQKGEKLYKADPFANYAEMRPGNAIGDAVFQGLLQSYRNGGC